MKTIAKTIKAAKSAVRTASTLEELEKVQEGIQALMSELQQIDKMIDAGTHTACTKEYSLVAQEFLTKAQQISERRALEDLQVDFIALYGELFYLDRDRIEPKLSELDILPDNE